MSLSRAPRVGWSFNLFPDAAEGGGCFRSSWQSRSRGVRGAAKDPERAAVEAQRRARARLRRYCTANRLNRLGTLTYAGAGCHEYRQASRDAGLFFRALRDGVVRKPFPYAWTSEWHPGGLGLHLHFAVGRFISVSDIRRVWGRGIVHIKLLGDLPVGSTSLDEARVAAGYLSKYVAKSFDEKDRPPGMHRFDVGQGFTPSGVKLWAPSASEALRLASEEMGSSPALIWSSTEAEEWNGPPAIWAQWQAV